MAPHRHTGTLIVSLGAGLAGERQTGPEWHSIGKATRMRAAAAASVWLKNPDALLLFCGGRSHPQLQISEAEAMKGYVTHSPHFRVPESAVLTEEESVDTAHSVRNSVALLKRMALDPEKILVVTGARHLLRTARYFRAYGFPVTVISVEEALADSPVRHEFSKEVHGEKISKRAGRNEALLHMLQWFDRKGRIASALVRWWRSG
ncbi:MAG: YdcF family protein [Candidatus Peregrinibacteria bacterium]|nr:YdcF family protein [Candidatus Peregrinibacteria bacterium]